jgi:glycosyltransferase involved in cell wall biosynthesis/O-antigen/teichoic acid export membrane protein
LTTTSKLLRWIPPDVRSLGIGSFSLVVALSLQNVSNLIFHVAVSRLVGPSDYGELAALLSVALVISVPVSVVQAIVAKDVARVGEADAGGEQARHLRAMTQVVALCAVPAAVLMIAATPLLMSFLHVSWKPAVLLGPFLYAALISGVAYGGLQGSLRFNALAAVVVSAVLARLVLGIALTTAGMGVEGAMLATVVAQGVSCLLALRLIEALPRTWRVVGLALEPFRRDLRPSLLALGSFAIFAQVDLILARHFLGATEAGLYSGAGLISRAVLFLPGAVALVAFPRFASAPSDPGEALRWLHLSMLATVGIVAAVLPFVVLGSEPVVVRVLGSSYREAATAVPLLSLAMGCMAVTNLLVYYHLAAETYAHRIVLGGAVALAAGISIFHGSINRIGLVVVLAGATVVVLLYHAAKAASVWPRSHIAAHSRRSASAVDVTVVLPCHNPGPALRELLDRLVGGALEPSTFEIIVVSDGSTDDTVSIAESFKPLIRLIELPARGGKGGALKAGMSIARGRYVAFMDSDGDIRAEDIKPFVSLMDLYEPDIILGSKRHPLSQVNYPLVRRVMSWTYHKLARLLFRVNVRDTQTGLKMIRRDVLDAVLPRMLEKRFAFDLELLVVARRLGYNRVFEAPVHIDFRFGSHVDPKQTVRIVLDTLAIGYRRFVLGTYDTWRGDASSTVGVVDGTAASSAMRTRLEPTVGSARIRPLRILFLNWRDVRNPDGGGAEVFTHELAKRWAKLGHIVELWTSRFDGCLRVEQVDGVVIKRIGNLRRGSLHLRVFRELRRLKGFDLVVEGVNSVPFFTPVFKEKSPPTVTVIHQLAREVWFAELPRVLALIGAWAEPRVLSLYRGTPVVTVSESTRADLAELGVEATVIPEGFTKPTVGRSIVAESSPLVLFVGRLARNKQPNHAVDAFRTIKAEMPAAKLAIVGRGPMEDEISRDLPAGAALLGHVPAEELGRLMSSADCVLVPSTREGWGLVVLEANSVGTPCVGYDVPGLRDSIVDGQTGILVPANDSRALGMAAVSLLTDPLLADEMSSAASAWAERFSWEEMADRWSAYVSGRFPPLGSLVDHNSEPEGVRPH